MGALFVMTWMSTSRGAVWQPPMDVYETENDVVIRIEIAGVSPDQVDISLADRVLTVSGVRQDPAPKVGYHRMEILYGPFQASTALPRRVDPTHISAQYHDGFLTVTVPKPDPIRVHVDGGAESGDERQAGR
jgi:HSP20 family protein